MDKLLRPASFLFYFLTIVVFFFIGASVTVRLRVVHDQGMTGGPEVLMYGILSSLVFWIISLVLAYVLPVKTIILLNKVLGLLLVGFIAFAIYKLTKS